MLRRSLAIVLLLTGLTAAQARTIEIQILADGRICLDGGPAVPLAKVSPALRELIHAHARAETRIVIDDTASQATARRAIRVFQ